MNDDIFERIHKSLTVEQIMTPKDEFYFHPKDSAFHKDITIFPIKNEYGKIIKYFNSINSKERILFKLSGNPFIFQCTFFSD